MNWWNSSQQKLGASHIQRMNLHVQMSKNVFWAMQSVQSEAENGRQEGVPQPSPVLCAQFVEFGR